MFRLSHISPDTTVFPWAKRTPAMGLLPVMAVGLLLALGAATGHEAAGAIAAGAAYTVGFAIFHEALASTLLTMGMVTLGIASATLAGSLGAEWTPVVLVLALLAALNYGLLADVSANGGWIGQQCAIFVIVNSYFPNGLREALGRTAMVLLGGAVQMLIFTARHFVRHAESEQDAPPLSHRLRGRVSQLWDGLRGHARTYDDTWSYVLRLALTLVLCTALYRYRHIRNGYWAPMTALLVLKPQWTGTLSRGFARLAGTLVGAGIALLMARFVVFDTYVIFLMVLVCAWACYALQAVNYAVFSLFTTLYIVFLFRFGGFSQTSAAHIRLFNTALGGGVALLVDAAWKAVSPRFRTIDAVVTGGKL